ncbi:MAG TPA: FliM/FliN family flagellar motor switch protein [Terriglobales bacterium]|nr:FliM/FliN family flagellar motor switch protein [Terriglobales bacterium]
MSTPGTPQTDKKQAAPAPANDSGKLDLLLDVNLALTLRFGQRDLTLREILELNAGSVIELDRAVEEPAELLLGDRVIARGQVVTVDGNYGIRITDMPVQG